MGEFDLIQRFFTRPTPRAVLGVGDDCALLQASAGMQQAISTDMLVSGRHFFPDVDPRALGHKSLAVNLSDLAACGAKPVAFTLALALPDADENWLERFSQGLLELADAHGCELIGGDTTRGPLTICITVFGEIPAGQALLRSGTQAGDDIYASGTLGDASLALAQLLWQRAGATTPPPLQLAATDLIPAKKRLEQPTPRLALGQALRGVATAAADISDGLLGDLGHILERSHKGATLDTAAVFQLLGAHLFSPEAAAMLGSHAVRQQVLQHVLSGGDDYELVFTAAPAQREAVQAAARASGTPVTRIGQIDAVPGLRLLGEKSELLRNQNFHSFDHFTGGV
jgi:thiamine-monophosphate kinase